MTSVRGIFLVSIYKTLQQRHKLPKLITECFNFERGFSPKSFKYIFAFSSFLSIFLVYLSMAMVYLGKTINSEIGSSKLIFNLLETVFINQTLNKLNLVC